MSNNIRIRNIDPQEIIIDGSGTPSGITNVYVNGVDVTVGTKAYVIVPTKLSELTNDEGFITAAEETDPTVPYYVKEITVADINNWNDKQDALVSGTTIKTINGNSILGSGNLLVGTEYTAGTGIDISGTTINNTITSYNDLTDLPSIPTNTSDLVNDSGFITNQVDDLVNYLPKEVIENMWPQVSDSGTELYLADTTNYELNIKLDPHEIVQHTTTGKNLFNKDTAESGKIINRDTGNADVSGSYSASDYIPVEESENYVWSNFNRWYSAYYDEDKTYTGYPTNTASITIPAGVKYIRLSCETTNIDIAQFEKGTTVTSYEEYTGGMASPNPDYPQELHLLSGENTINVIGKNLFNYDQFVEDNSTATITGTAQAFNYTGAGITSKYKINYVENAQYKITGTWSTNSGNGRVRIIYTDGTTQTMFEDYSLSNLYQQPINTTSYSSKTIDYIEIITWTTGNFYIRNLQIERGTTATDYEEYQSQSFQVNLTVNENDIDYSQITRTDLGIVYKDEMDYFNIDNVDLIGIKKAITKIDLKNYTWSDEGEYSGAHKFSTSISEQGYWYISNYFSYNLNGNKTYLEFSGYTLYMYIDNSFGITTVNDLNTWLSNQDEVLVYYAIHGWDGKFLDDQETFNNLLKNTLCYKGGTTINQENFDLPYEIEASTLKDLSNL